MLLQLSRLGLLIFQMDHITVYHVGLCGNPGTACVQQLVARMMIVLSMSDWAAWFRECRTTGIDWRSEENSQPPQLLWREVLCLPHLIWAFSSKRIRGRSVLGWRKVMMRQNYVTFIPFKWEAEGWWSVFSIALPMTRIKQWGVGVGVKGRVRWFGIIWLFGIWGSWERQ